MSKAVDLVHPSYPWIEEPQSKPLWSMHNPDKATSVVQEKRNIARSLLHKRYKSHLPISDHEPPNTIWIVSSPAWLGYKDVGLHVIYPFINLHHTTRESAWGLWYQSSPYTTTPLTYLTTSCTTDCHDHWTLFTTFGGRGSHCSPVLLFSMAKIGDQ